jgi:putative membrane protein
MSRNSKVLLGVVGGAFVVLVLLVTIFAGSGLFGSGSMMGQGDMMGQGWGVLSVFGMGLMMLGVVLVPLLLLGALIAVIVLAVMQLGSGGHAASGRHAAGGAGVHEQSAEESLRQRFARGEIDGEDYEGRRRILMGESPAAHRANADGGSLIRPMPPGE